MKRHILFIFLIVFVFVSCVSVKEGGGYTPAPPSFSNNNEITRSLFNDKSATISETDIQRILEGKFDIPAKSKVAIINIDNAKTNYYYRNNSEFLTSRQKYIDYIKTNLDDNGRVTHVSWIPPMMTGESPSFTAIREAGVRMQADVVIAFSITEGSIYSKVKMFSTDHKAFATTQVMVIDVRTGLIPYTDISTKDYLLSKEEKDNKSFNDEEKRQMAQEQAVILTLKEINNGINHFLNK